MNRSLSTLFLLCVAAGFISGINVQAEDEFPRVEAVECRERGGIPNFLQKLKKGDGEELRVAYLGGSITAAPGWRVKSLAWLQEIYPDAKLSGINAAIGGTGSDLGVFRVQQDVLAHRPDLLFVEFAVNDGGASPERIQKGMEGIVRQTREANPETDIIFVYTLSEPFLEDLQNGKFSRSASAMEAVADHYGIPSIHFGLEVAAMEKSGKLLFKGEKPADDDGKDAPVVFSTDGVHPLVETGHELYLKAIQRSWEKIAAATDPGTESKELIEPLRDDHWGAAKLVPISESMLRGDWVKLEAGENGDTIAKRFSSKMPQMWRARTPGAALTLKFRGSQIGVYDIVGPDGGQLQVSLDGGEPKAYRRMDGYCTYHRLSKIQVGSDLSPETVHTVEITLDSAIPNKKEILFERNRDDFDKNPDKYTENIWNVGALLLIGEVVE
jgi:lysophospholipase L1-like esterase